MQVIAHTGCQELADILKTSTVLDTTDHGSMRMLTVEFNGQDILLFVDGNNNFFSVYPPDSFDAESGGSVHDHARAIKTEYHAANDDQADDDKAGAA